MYQFEFSGYYFRFDLRSITEFIFVNFLSSLASLFPFSIAFNCGVVNLIPQLGLRQTPFASVVGV
jgi:hypothetical protein